MKYIRYLFLLCLAVVLIAVALANREFVQLQLLPEGLARVIGMNPSTSLPLFVVIFGGVVAGLLIGFVWEWLREHKHRAEVSRKEREVGKLEREVKKLKGEKNQGKDEVLALLD
ncbi:lipopolysaccharide assembly protein LapA domain-containing protein [Pseudooceanicola sp. MF1-13]|uniref:lipopolysaccharide assembly protein LapA domain-containing protein n=1 Tax=Pseudooceanicola sp. MF1-13 TaxID=3379095 RepID=UPI003891843C